MIFETCYGEEIIPALEESSGKEKCPYCNKKNKKGQKVIYLAVNSGPVGRVFMCPKHAKLIAQEILKLVSNL